MSNDSPQRHVIAIDPEDVFYLARMAASPLPPEFPADADAALKLWLQDTRGELHETLPILLRRSQIREMLTVLRRVRAVQDP